jgi:hypothetical protein
MVLGQRDNFTDDVRKKPWLEILTKYDKIFKLHQNIQSISRIQVLQQKYHFVNVGIILDGKHLKKKQSGKLKRNKRLILG